MGKATMTVERRRGEVSIEDLKRKKSALVEVGILSGTGKHPSSDSATAAEIAAYLEYGTEGSKGRRGINEYAAFRTWLKKKRTAYREMIRSLAIDYTKGEIPLRKVFSTLGLAGQKDLRETMKILMTPENEESTQLRKGAKTGTPGTMVNNPTIDTGRLRQLVSWGKV